MTKLIVLFLHKSPSLDNASKFSDFLKASSDNRTAEYMIPNTEANISGISEFYDENHC
jgi:hypothetical protein